MKKIFTIQNVFIFLIIVVLPIVVAYYSISNMIEEQFLAEKDLISNDLRHQISRVELASQAQYQIKDFFTILLRQKQLVRQKPEVIKQFIEKANEYYPGAFKWFFFDENFEAMPVKSPYILEGSRFWQPCLKAGIYVYNRLVSGTVSVDMKTIQEKYTEAKGSMQRMMDPGNKPEHIFEKKNSVVELQWLGKKCYMIWDVDGVEFSRYNTTTKIAGGFVLAVFPEKLPDDIWYKRLIFRRKKSRDNFQYPIAAINISSNEMFEFDAELPRDNLFTYGLIDAHNKRSNEIFEYRNYLVGVSEPRSDEEIRLLSLADISDADNARKYMKLMLGVTCNLLVLLSLLSVLLVKRIRLSGVSLRQRIAIIFTIAMILPVLSLISIGKTFIAHEEGRLKESALVKMRAGLESLGMRYKDTPRLIERGLFEELHQKIGPAPHTVKTISKGMEQAIEEGIIEQYFLYKNDKIAATSWVNIDKTLEKTLQYMAKKMTNDEQEIDSKGSNALRNFVDAEIADIIEGSTGGQFDFSRPTHLRSFVYLDQQMYFMSINTVIDGQVCPLFVYLPEPIIERNFGLREFATNNIAAQQLPGSVLIPELTFYATFPGEENMPPDSPIWDKLKDVIERSYELKIEEVGQIKIDNENFLYLIKPLASMNTKSIIPCLLTSTNGIENRVRDAGIILFALSALAILGTILLSFVLSSSLLVPIKKIDVAAQQIGHGDLSVVLPNAGNDELGRLSQTFNDMVKGLREREKMQAYVSDSVLEAVKDDSDQSVHEGKHIEATILFSDIRNFTGMSEANPPNKMFECLNEYFGGVEPIIRNNYGRVDKYIGDAVMAIFHHTEPEHHAISAIKAAVQMREYLAEMNKSRKANGQFTIEIGIGISTGKVLLGDLGSKHRKDLTVIGDEVNLASRLESASKQGHHTKIIFSGSTRSFVENLVEDEKLPFEEIRGKKHSVQIYELVRMKEQA